MNTLQDIIHSAKDEMVQSLQDCLRIKSVNGQQEAVIRALDFYLNLAKDMGFKASNIENLGGIIEFGEGPKAIGIIVHLDVVPEGTGWNSPPFAGRVEAGKIYGRGAIDDKGPAISALYALKAAKDFGLPPKSNIQIIIGIDEENIWSTTPRLLKKIKEPDFSFVPDSNFPLVIAEKGLVWLEINLGPTPPKTEKQTQEKYATEIRISSINGGGDSLNLVPDSCQATLTLADNLLPTVWDKLKSFTKTNGCDIVLEKNNPDFTLISKGKSAHASVCNEGVNAISQLLLFLNELDIVPEQKTFIRLYTEKIGMDFYGERLGLGMEDELTGKLTVSPGFLSFNQDAIILKLDIRFPASRRLDEITNKVLEAFTDFKAKLKIIDSLEALSFPTDDPNIKKLLAVYSAYSGDRNPKPLGMGGTTFAKAFKRAVAFGPTFPGMEKVEHQPDEYMEIDHLLRCTEIYAQAIIELAKD